MLETGVGESGEFYRAHPLLNFLYFLFVIGVGMFTMHPVFLAAGFVCSWGYCLVLLGKKSLKLNLLILLPVVVLMTLFNTLNVHNGVTVLFYLNDNRITLEAVLYGLASAILMTNIIVWFRCFTTIITADKFIYLFGRAAPALALTLSMILRYIPLLRNRFQEISMGQRCMGRVSKGRSLLKKLRLYGKEISILIAWSLEASIESADSMEARGYGLHGRTNFHLFKLAGREKGLMALMALLGGGTALACAMGKLNIYYYPTIICKALDGVQWLALLAYTALMFLPLVMDVRGWKTWNCLYAKM